MAITREKKERLVTSYVDQLSQSKAAFLTDYRGLTVSDMEALRAKIREAGGRYTIVKNTLIRRAFQSVGMSVPDELITGPTAIGFAYEEIPPVAKALTDFAKETGILQVKGGLVEGKVLTPQEVKALASLPPREVVLAQLLGLIQQSGNRVAGVINAAGSKLAATIKAYADKLEETAATV